MFGARNHWLQSSVPFFESIFLRGRPITNQTVNVDRIIDENPIGRTQWRVVMLCFLLAIIDGIDASTTSYVAPLLAEDFGLGARRMGALHSAALLGLMLGAFVGSPIADRWGRKPVIILFTAVMGVFSLLTASSNDTQDLFIYRFLTGIGIGGVMPAINTLTAEFAPLRRRALLMTLMFIGFPGGVILGGVAAAFLIGQYGWESVFILGGILPLLIVPVLLWFLPESPRFLALRGLSPNRLATILNNIAPHAGVTAESRFHVVKADSKQGVRALFDAGYMPITLLLWLVMFCNLLTVYALVGWMPWLLEAAGFPLERAILASVLLSIGGVVGGLFVAVSVDRLGATRVLAPALAIAAVFIALIGQTTGSIPLMLAMLFLAGFAVIGSQFGLNALAAMSYETSARATGLGWALAVGRFGAVVGPIMVGAAVAAQLAVGKLFLVAAVPMIVGALVVLALASAVRAVQDA